MTNTEAPGLETGQRSEAAVESKRQAQPAVNHTHLDDFSMVVVNNLQGQLLLAALARAPRLHTTTLNLVVRAAHGLARNVAALHTRLCGKTSTKSRPGTAVPVM
jgi:hypothetical protein